MTIIKKIKDSEWEYWNQAVENFAMVHPLNAYGWGKVREVDGWKPTYFIVKEEDEVKGMIMVLEKKIPWTGFSVMYAVKGPIFELNDVKTLKNLLTTLWNEGKKNRAIFLRIDPNITEDQILGNGDPFVAEGFIHLVHRWSFWNSPRDVYRIDLRNIQSESELFNSIDRQSRKAVRKAAKEGVTIRPASNIEELRVFYDIFSRFSVEKGFMHRKYQYQEALWNQYIARDNGRLFLAVYDGKIIGGLICLLFGGKCLAMHMGTLFQYNHLRANDAYVWESIRWAWDKGCSWYSFRGVGTTPTQERFKRKFSPRVVSLMGYYDLPFRPVLYQLFYHLEFKILPRVYWSIMRIRKVLGNLWK